MFHKTLATTFSLALVLSAQCFTSSGVVMMETPCFFARFSVGRLSVKSSQPRFLAMAKPATVKEETQYILQPDEEDQRKRVKTKND